MANPFNALVRMLEQRIARQEVSLVESKLQLEAAILARAEHEDGDKSSQLDIASQIARTVKDGPKGTRST
jgi:hypothetical protein